MFAANFRRQQQKRKSRIQTMRPLVFAREIG
jgi:hypothetical protein